MHGLAANSHVIVIFTNECWCRPPSWKLAVLFRPVQIKSAKGCVVSRLQVFFLFSCVIPPLVPVFILWIHSAFTEKKNHWIKPVLSGSSRAENFCSYLSKASLKDAKDDTCTRGIFVTLYLFLFVSSLLPLPLPVNTPRLGLHKNINNTCDCNSSQGHRSWSPSKVNTEEIARPTVVFHEAQLEVFWVGVEWPQEVCIQQIKFYVLKLR